MWGICKCVNALASNDTGVELTMLVIPENQQGVAAIHRNPNLTRSRV